MQSISGEYNMATTNLNFRVDEKLKKQAQSVIDSYGLTFTQVFKMFLYQVAKTGKIPVSLDYNAREVYRDDVIQELLQAKEEEGTTFTSTSELIEWLRRDN